MNITVYGAASENINQQYKKSVEALGEEIAKRGHTLIFGGGKNGLMGAVARGVYKQGGKSIGIAPKFFLPDGVLFENCSEFIYTEDMRSRKALLEQKANAIIMVPGGIGTYDEFFEVFTLNSLGRIDKPIAVFNVNGYYKHLKNLLNATAEEGFMNKSLNEKLLFSDNIEEIFEFLENKKES